MDNFDHEGNTLSGIEGSHDTILVLFQKNETIDNIDKISHRPGDIATMPTKKRSLNHTLHCQKLIRRSKFSNRGTIAAEFRPTKPPDIDAIVQKSKVRYETWCTLRYLSHKSQDVHSIPLFCAINSFLQNDKPMKTKVAFTLILPYVATEYDTVHTAMCNFQDALLQKSQPYGPLWCDEGVYRLAKELQLLNPTRFDNMFLGLEGFHMEKVMIACCGKYLEDTGIESIFVENEVYGPEKVKSVMNRGNYVRGMRGMGMISEVLNTLLLGQYTLQTKEDDKFEEIVQQARSLAQLIRESNFESASKDWKRRLAETIEPTEFKNFKANGEIESKQFRFWYNFIERIYPVLRDLTSSHREGNWQLYLSAIKRALPLVFAFDRTNYKRWLPLYFEDCLILSKNFP